MKNNNQNRSYLDPIHYVITFAIVAGFCTTTLPLVISAMSSNFKDAFQYIQQQEIQDRPLIKDLNQKR